MAKMTEDRERWLTVREVHKELASHQNKVLHLIQSPPPRGQLESTLRGGLAAMRACAGQVLATAKELGSPAIKVQVYAQAVLDMLQGAPDTDILRRLSAGSLGTLAYAAGRSCHQKSLAFEAETVAPQPTNVDAGGLEPDAVVQSLPARLRDLLSAPSLLGLTFFSQPELIQNIGQDARSSPDTLGHLKPRPHVPNSRWDFSRPGFAPYWKLMQKHRLLLAGKPGPRSKSKWTPLGKKVIKLIQQSSGSSAVAD